MIKRVKKVRRSYYYRLPFPPSAFTYWRVYQSRVYISAKGTGYRKEALLCIGDSPRLKDRLAVHIECVMPDRRKRDLDNIPKCVLDALTAAEVWVDDEQIDDLRIRRLHVESPGCVDVTVTRLEEA